jgi:hypothetical protein
MKNQKICINLIVMLLSLITNSFAQSSWSHPIKSMFISYAVVPVTLDGAADEEFYSEEQTTVIFDPRADSGSTGNEDLSAVFKVCFDATNLYVQANITDGVGEWENDANDPWTTMDPNDSWQYDNSEIFFDLDTNGSFATAYDSTCVQLRINRGRDSLMTVSDNTHELPLIDPLRKVFWANDGDAGWIYEVAIPWTAIAPAGSNAEDISAYIGSGLIHGFDISFGDADKTGGVHAARSRQASWDVEPGYSETTFNNRTQFGLICMGDCGPGATYYTNAGNISVHPNPVTNLVTFENLEGATSVKIMNITGQIVLTADLTNNTLNMSRFENGIYFIAIGTNVLKIIKQ